MAEGADVLRLNSVLSGIPIKFLAVFVSFEILTERL